MDPSTSSRWTAAKFEHSVSTGARDPGFNEEKFQKMAEFADENKRLYAPQWNNLLKYFTANPNDVNTNSNMRSAGVPGRGVDMMAVSGAMLVADATKRAMASHCT